MKINYVCEICNQEVKPKTEEMVMSIDFKNGEKVMMTKKVCEVCAEYLVEFLGLLSESADGFYKDGDRRKLKIVFDDETKTTQIKYD